MIDLVGIRFERLVVIVPKPELRKHSNVIWECKCDCGKIKMVSSSNLRSGHTK